MNKVLGYGICALGLVSILLGLDFVQEFLNLNFLQEVSSYWFTAGGIALVVLGTVFILMSSKAGRKAIKEVPIYHGKEVVGYRRK